MNNEGFSDLLDNVIEEVQKAIVDWKIEQNCIHASLLLTKVLHGMGIRDAYPLVVGVIIKEPGMPEVRIGKSGVPLPSSQWDGHLGVVVPNAYGHQHAFVDLTIPRPELGLDLPPICLSVGDDFAAGRCGATFQIPDSEIDIHYSTYADDRSYNDRGDVTKIDGFDEAVSLLLSRLEQ